MNEADQNRIQRERVINEAARRVTEDLAQEGKLILGGWRAYELIHGLIESPEAETPQKRFAKECLHDAYYSGAQHLFASIMNILEEGQEATEGDVNKLTAIHEELDQWVAQQKAKR